MICKNCNNKFEGEFCNQCGQSSKVERISWNYLSKSIIDSIFQINYGFLFTVKTLLLSPGKSLNDFFLGKRKKFYKPFAFLLISSSVFLISTKFIGNDTFVDDFVNGFRNGVNENLKNSVELKTLDFLTKNQTYVFLIIAPLFSLASFLAFKKNKYNFSEHLILNLYITGEQLLIYSLFSFIKDRNSLLAMIPLILGIFYNLYVYNRLFYEFSWLNKNLKLILTYLIYLILLIITLIVILIITTVNNAYN
ncbi:DUF3667 domain-containing protein [Urechidicola sp. KH5]